MLILDRILGQASDPALADRLHDLSHAGQVETLSLSGSDIQRHRLRLASDRGTDCAIRLERHQQLRNGSVLMLDSQRAIVVQMQDQQYLDRHGTRRRRCNWAISPATCTGRCALPTTPCRSRSMVLKPITLSAWRRCSPTAG